MKSITTIIILMLFSFGLNAQIYFQKTIGGGVGDQPYSTAQLNDGGYVIAGSTASFGAGLADGYVARMDANGDTIWTRAYGGTNEDEFYFIQQTADNGFIACGFTSSFGAGLWDTYLVKMDANGDTLWTRAYGGTGYESGGSVQQTFDGGYIITGYTDSYGNGGLYELYLIRTNATGDTLWTRTYGGGNWEWGNYVRQTADSGFIATGATISYGAGNYELYLVKTDANGDTLWTRTYGESGNDEGYAVQQTADNGYIVLGITDNFGAGNPDFYVLKLDANGDTLWTKAYGGTADDYGYAAQQTADGGYIFAGLTQSFGAGVRDAYLIRTDANGDTLWTRTYGGILEDWANSVHECSDKGFVLSVSQESFGAGAYDFLMLKVDSMGDVGCNQYNTATQIGNTASLKNYGGAIGSGGIVSNTATVVSSAASQESLLCVKCDSLIANFNYVADSFDVDFFDSSLAATGWYWDFGDGNNSTEQNPNNIYLMPGVYIVCLITSNACTTDTVCDTITIICALPPPVAGFVFGTMQLSASFFSICVNTTTWSWDFGDGSPLDNAPNPLHVYAAAGTYNVCLTASSTCGTDITCDSVTVISTGIQPNDLQNAMLIYPNPNSGIITIHTADKRISAVDIYNVVGEKVYQSTYIKEEMDISSLPAGVYMLSALDTQGVPIARQKIIRQ